MRIVRPTSDGGKKGSGFGSSVHSRPDWLQEWIENKGQYVKLRCGHRLDLKDDRTMTKVDGQKKAWCYMHEDVVEIEKSIGLFEFHYGFPPPPTPDEPPY